MFGGACLMTENGLQKIRLQILTSDPKSIRTKGIKSLAGWDYETDEVFLDGPVTRRIAVLDFDPVTGQLEAGADFVPPGHGKKLGMYKISKPNNLHSADLRQVSVFSTVLKTMDMFEEKDVLGRKVQWAFEGEQLLVVPRAGEAQNAFYHRDSRSLSFFYFDSPGGRGKTRRVYTCLSPDIVSHETAHAMIDAIAPDLYNAVAPQSLALHEALADLTAVILALRVDALKRRVLKLTMGDLKKADAFDRLAEEFGEAKHGPDRPYLRRLRNEASLNPKWGEPVRSREPHDLSEVLSGALYELLLYVHAKDTKRFARELNQSAYSASGKALFSAGGLFKRMLFRALDYLPPGEISFADYGRAIYAADRDFYPADSDARAFLAGVFVRRGIIKAPHDLEVPGDFPADILSGVELEDLIASDWLAYRFVEENRQLLHIPDGVPFNIRARLVSEKSRFHASANVSMVRQCILKISWDEVEENRVRDPLAEHRRVRFGTTLVVDMDERRITTILSTNPALRRGEAERQSTERDMHLAQLFASGQITVTEADSELPLQADGPVARISNGVMRVYNTAHLLHITHAHEPAGHDDD